ncbi:hypothetical protein TWF694_010935 [Orbilia ellipsospora]|uniref:NADH dehydrogenase [ubiquinone] 1 alpha subcomplex subunit 1 n=1 Tax=Orbilia ellipsospora TaxID=2528407 RepID=A0AAV9X7H8_9PEZI
MPVPWEALLHYGIVIGMFGITGAGLSVSAWYQNGRKPKRWALDTWDNQMMRRDHRLTNYWRGQVDEARAPEGFELSSRWRLEKRIT